MNPGLKRLQPYPFARWQEAIQGLELAASAPKTAIKWSIGEPQHPPPAFVVEALREALSELGRYPLTAGQAALRESIASWLERRFSLTRVDPVTQVLPCNGTREALFAIAQVLLGPGDLALMPSPGYQIYEGAAFLAGAEAQYLPCLPETGQPDFEAVSVESWKACRLLTICSPHNPTGAVLERETLIRLIELADQYDFTIASDECYSELYFSEPPPGLLEACEAIGRKDFARCLVFHSLSKRSSLPGMRSGFVAGDARLIKAFLTYRTYHGSAMPPHHQVASTLAWADEVHVEENRQLYARKRAAALSILSLPLLEAGFELTVPPASFYLWLRVPPDAHGRYDDLSFARELYREQNLTLLPGSFLSRRVQGQDPGLGYLRLALVASEAETLEGAERLRAFVESRLQSRPS